jgi:hypothetical protein
MRYCLILFIAIVLMGCNRYPKENSMPHLVVNVETLNEGRPILQNGDQIKLTSTIISAQSVSQLSHSWVKESEEDYIVYGNTVPLADIVKIKNTGFVNDTSYFTISADNMPGAFVVKSMAIDNNGNASGQIRTRPTVNFVTNDAFPIVLRLSPDSLVNSLKINDSVRINMLGIKLPTRTFTSAKVELVYKDKVLQTKAFDILSDSDSLAMKLRQKVPNVDGLTLGDKLSYRFTVSNDLGNSMERRVNYIITQ